MPQPQPREPQPREPHKQEVADEVEDEDDDDHFEYQVPRPADPPNPEVILVAFHTVLISVSLVMLKALQY